MLAEFAEELSDDVEVGTKKVVVNIVVEVFVFGVVVVVVSKFVFELFAFGRRVERSEA